MLHAARRGLTMDDIDVAGEVAARGVTGCEVCHKTIGVDAYALVSGGPFTCTGCGELLAAMQLPPT